MKKYGMHWNVVRVLRLVSGVFIIFAGVQVSDGLVMTGGALLSLMSLLNIGCCGTSACYRLPRQKNKKGESIIYEEIR
ncbi:hypothetical protein LL912_02440 [Niabella sp. CC-SYL272]|uniref:hypothetical protein n=1 Tax=Niabella agricola TaxID=2891571 RepID=UPI001F1F1389|nr:hypothetical protein [Niabella agricola]MCF3107629.1 hypothetical protein [Niabella agricola]